MSSYDNIKFYPDSEVNKVLLTLTSHPMFKELMSFTFPDKDETYFQQLFQSIHSIYDFQSKVIYHTMQRILEKTSESLTSNGRSEEHTSELQSRPHLVCRLLLEKKKKKQKKSKTTTQ